jgi:hypothetical protein
MIYFIIVGAPCAIAWLLIGIALCIADTKNRAAWSRIVSESEVTR